MRFILHIGLHKTGTTTLQKWIFPNFRDRLNYNPKELVRHLNLCCYGHDLQLDIADHILAARAEVRKLVSQDHDVLISLEKLGQNFHLLNYPERIELIERVFEGVPLSIVCVLRYQPHWMVSAYKQSIARSHYQPIGDFLNYSSGEFAKPDSGFRSGSALPRVDALGLDYAALVDSFQSRFGKENCHFLFFEKLFSDRSSAQRAFERLSGLTEGALIRYERERPGFSATACRAAVLQGRIVSAFRGGLAGLSFRERESKFMRKHVSSSPTSRVSKRLGRVATRFLRIFGIRSTFSARHIIPEVVDLFWRGGGDLLSPSQRRELDEHYRRINAQLHEVPGLPEVPEIYFKTAEIEGKPA